MMAQSRCVVTDEGDGGSKIAAYLVSNKII